MAIKACEDQIAISKKAVAAFLGEKRFALKPTSQMTDDILNHIDPYEKYNGMTLPDGFDPQYHMGPDCVETVRHELPEHTGFKQLCIVREKQGNYDEVIRLSTRAKEEGWRGDWDKRIEKAKKKLEQGR